ncbi:putative threonine aspartase protein [Botrytis fragariae]|uniref:Putative threonine aspartase protein n=1 Tax=Botrytis fragariae TaxID=1964551 RepID=A0A8H6AML6_9HELO|nr:putative threonine aspartase protein [Botrytis fragariae]KAF5870252.1 putative threonine aspartase protein [Botrytis fragariae]
MSELTQRSTSLPQQSLFANKIDIARERLRQLRRELSNLSNPLRKFQKYNIEIIPSPFLDCEGPWSGSPPLMAPTPFYQNMQTSRMPAMSFDPVMDGSADTRRLRPAQPQPCVSAIFVHAGAGYHSTTNEHIHLGACNDAARAAMRILKAGGSAVDAVEAAIKVLEDKEITNAGYGSNLSIEGIVECDATVVDHLGRSGACGATAQIKNPVSLARLILEASSRPLSLRRVPPNLLVGQGATDFAWEHGIPVVPHDMMCSKNARERYIRWRDDLRRAEGQGRMTPSSNNSSQAADDEAAAREYEERVRAKQRRDHTNALMTGTWNEGQPDSPSTTSPGRACPQECGPYSPRPGTPPSRGYFQMNAPGRGASRSPVGTTPAKRARLAALSDGSPGRVQSLLSPSVTTSGVSSEPGICPSTAPSTIDRPSSTDGHLSPTDQEKVIEMHSASLDLAQEGTIECPHESTAELLTPKKADVDLITDTVGAIAIDMYGRIAAASSSGGIGMKHRGRVGPAALVGIGTAVVPCDERDEDQVSVAAVTSGTGEHMATTMASQKCADRLYHNTRRARGGQDMEANEDEAMESFVQADFMGHPGVSGSNSAGAIGVMAVKKTQYGYFLHFAHNTDSFALASYASNEKDAKCVMSRLGDHGNVVRGGRKVKIDKE